MILPLLKKWESVAAECAKLMPLTVREGKEEWEYRCPTCDGEGYVDGRDFDTEGAANIIAFGIGESMETAERYLQTFSPPTVIALIEALKELLPEIECGDYCIPECPACQRRAKITSILSKAQGVG